MTLAEVMCAGFLLVAFLSLCAAALLPAARTMRRLRQVIEAQTIADSVLESVRAELEEAREYVRIERSDGGAVEFACGDGRILRISTGGPGAAEAGRLVYRYDGAGPDGAFRTEGAPEAGVEEAVFPEDFYMGLYLGLRFSPVLEDGLLMRVQITAQLGKGVENTGEGTAVRDVICTERVIAGLRYATVLENGVRVKTGLPLYSGGAG